MQMRCVSTNRRPESRDGWEMCGRLVRGLLDGASQRPTYQRGGGVPAPPLCAWTQTNLRRLNVLLIVLVVEASLTTGGKNTFVNAT